MADHSKRSSSARFSRRAGSAKTKKSMPVGQIRIVAGRWRGRKLSVIDSAGLRPTGDRVRETLFNWLQMSLPGSRCLDLYAGSGALGLEAASRGASSVTLVESSAPVAEQLRHTLDELNAGEEVTLRFESAERYLATRPQPFDVVFIDPPFDAQVHAAIIDQLIPEILNPDAQVYVEIPTQELGVIQGFPNTLTTIKEKRFGDVTAFLFRHNCT